MTLLLKDPEASLDYSIDWGAEYLGEDVLTASRWMVSPAEPGGVAVEGNHFSPSLATVKAGGGIAGRVYRLVNSVTVLSGRTDSRSIVLRVEAR